MSLILHHHDPATLRRRRLLSRVWAAMVIGWSLVRTLIVWAALGRYGLDPRVYLVVDLASSVVTGTSTPRMVIAFIDDHYRQAAEWAAVSLVAFLVPDVYIFLGTSHLPPRLALGVVAVIGVTLVASVVGVARKVHKGRVLRATVAAEATIPAGR